MPPAQAIHPSHPAAATSEAPPPQGAIPAPAASHTTMAQSIIPPGPIQPAAPVQPPLGQQNSPLLAQPAVVPPNSASVVSAHHSLAALAQPNMNQQGAAQKQGSAQSGQQQQPAQNGPVGPILNVGTFSFTPSSFFQSVDHLPNPTPPRPRRWHSGMANVETAS